MTEKESSYPSEIAAPKIPDTTEYITKSSLSLSCSELSSLLAKL